MTTFPGMETGDGYEEALTGEHIVSVTSAAIRARMAEIGARDLLGIRLVEYLVQDRGYDLEEMVAFLSSEIGPNSTVEEILLRHSMINEAEATAISASLHNMETVVLSSVEVEGEMARHMLTPEQAVEWQALPFSRDDLGRLLVAISDPSGETRDQIQKALSRETLVFFLADPAELVTWIERIYDPAAAGALSDLVASGEGEQGQRYVVREAALESRIVRIVDEVIDRARDARASDIHIEPGERSTQIRFRIDGVLRKVSEMRLSDSPRVLARIKTMAQMRVDETRAAQDGRATTRTGPDRIPLDLRVVTVPTIYGEQASIRLLDPSQAMLSLEQLGMSPQNQARYMEQIRKPHGVCLVTGPTGSGKSTTLYASLSRIASPEKKLISIEDPVEYRLPGIQQIDVSSHSEKIDFPSALRSILRADPDVIMVGEIRDLETAQIAIDAALTGHFLYSTLHTNTALGTVIRLSRLGVDPYLIAEAVEVLVAQRLVRRLCSCKIAEPLQADLLQSMRAPAWAWSDPSRTFFRANPEGCPECGGQGYSGRTGVHEVVAMSADLRAAIIDGAKQAEMEEIIRAEGVVSLRDDAMLKVWQGETSLEEIAKVA